MLLKNAKFDPIKWVVTEKATANGREGCSTVADYHSYYVDPESGRFIDIQQKGTAIFYSDTKQLLKSDYVLIVRMNYFNDGLYKMICTVKTLAK